jgi:hypothetical protein
MSMMLRGIVQLTNGGQEPGNRGILLVGDELVLAEDVATDTLDDTRLGITLILELTQAEREGTELLLHLGEDLTGCRALEAVSLERAAVEGRALSIDVLDFARAEA